MENIWNRGKALGISRGVKISSKEKFELHERMFGKHENKKNTYQKSYYLYDGTTKTMTVEMIREFCRMNRIDPNELVDYEQWLLDNPI